MKIKNITMVNFMNGCEGLVNKNLPNRLGYALVLNQGMFSREFIDAYSKKQQELANNNDTAGLAELLNTEIEANVQTVPLSVLNSMDECDKYDSLTPIDFANIRFMIDEEK